MSASTRRPRRCSRLRRHAGGHGGAGRGADPRAHQDDRAVPHQGQERAGAQRACCSSGMAARCRATARRWKRCPASAARPPMSCSTRRSASRRSRSIRMCSGSANRTGLAPGKTPRSGRDGAERVVPSGIKHSAHHWLILHGRYVCIARRPECPACVVRDLCRYPEKTPRPVLSAGHSHRRRPAVSARSRCRRRSAAQHPPGQHGLRLRQHHRRVLLDPGQVVQPSRVVGVSKHKGGRPAKWT